MTASLADRTVLGARIKRLLNSQHAEDDVGPVFSSLRPLGTVAAFGGMLRDLALAPVSEFSSDIDLVVDTHDAIALASSLAKFRTQRNRYGGYRIDQARWKIDVWTLYDTWAFRRQLVGPPSIANLVRTTFFNWDGIAYEIDSGTLHHLPAFFQFLEARLLEINLEPNANPEGNVVRALRTLLSRGAHFGPRLARYVSIALENMNVSAQPRDYRTFLSSSIVRDVVRQLQHHVVNAPDKTFCFPPKARHP